MAAAQKSGHCDAIYRTKSYSGVPYCVRYGMIRCATTTENHAHVHTLQVTTKKRETLILNVDGCIAACFVDLLRSCGAFTQEEVREDSRVVFLSTFCCNFSASRGARSVRFRITFRDVFSFLTLSYRRDCDLDFPAANLITRLFELRLLHFPGG